MYISGRQIEAVVKTLKDNEYRLSDGYKYYKESHNFDVDSGLREIAIDIIENLNEVIYHNAT